MAENILKINIKLLYNKKDQGYKIDSLKKSLKTLKNNKNLIAKWTRKDKKEKMKIIKDDKNMTKFL